jgi:hypothetical protein
MTSIFHIGHEQLTLAQNTNGENNFIVELGTKRTLRFVSDSSSNITRTKAPMNNIHKWYQARISK